MRARCAGPLAVPGPGPGCQGRGARLGVPLTRQCRHGRRAAPETSGARRDAEPNGTIPRGAPKNESIRARCAPLVPSGPRRGARHGGPAATPHECGWSASASARASSCTTTATAAPADAVVGLRRRGRLALRSAVRWLERSHAIGLNGSGDRAARDPPGLLTTPSARFCRH